MKYPTSPRRIDLFEAVKYDVRLHGFRFIAVEFSLAGLGALAVAAVEFLHASHPLPLLGGVWFLSVALNCLGVVVLAQQARRTGTSTYVSDRRLHLYMLELVVLLLVPIAVALATLQQWRSGDFQPGSDVLVIKEIS